MLFDYIFYSFKIDVSPFNGGCRLASFGCSSIRLLVGDIGGRAVEPICA